MALKKILLPVIIIGVLGAIAMAITLNPPKPQQQRGGMGPQMSVEVASVEPRDYRVRLQSYGTLQPRTQSMLVAQVGGQIVSINPNLRDGGFFEQGDVLVEIDSRDYVADVRIAESSLADARQALAEARARSEQARVDWERLGDDSEPSDLVLQIPQLEAAKARVLSAEAALEKARLDLERTKVRAPYAGRVLQKAVDIGQVVSQNAQLAAIYATDIVEVRLPLRNRDLPFIDLPETSRYSDETVHDGGRVEILSELGGSATWEAELVRTEGAIDATARQLHVIAQIVDPFSKAVDGRTPLKIGQYVTAILDGNTVPDALVVANSTIYQGTYVYVVEEGLLRRRDIDIAWQNDEEAIVSSGLVPGDQVVTTALGQVTSGIPVSVIGADVKLGNGRPAEPRAGADASARSADRGSRQ